MNSRHQRGENQSRQVSKSRKRVTRKSQKWFWEASAVLLAVSVWRMSPLTWTHGYSNH
jgi:hypothetical protein